MRSVICKFCNVSFQAPRSDAIRCKECRKKYLQEYRKRPTTRQRKKDKYKELRKQVLKGYGNKCECCGETHYEFLAVDHVNGGGRQERKTVSTYQIAKKIIDQNFPPAYRILCHNCNQSLGWFGYCPHNEKEDKTA